MPESTVTLNARFHGTVADVEPAGAPHVLVCIHGIRDNAGWASESLSLGERFGRTLRIVPLSYPRVGLAALLTLRRDGLDRRCRDIAQDLERIRADFPDSPVSVLCHSFGTKLVLGAVPLLTFDLTWLFLCGSIVRLDDLGNVRRVVNDIVGRDHWPLLAEAVRPGLFAGTGSYGFHSHPVIDRFFAAYSHGTGVSRPHIAGWIVPVIRSGLVMRQDIPALGFRKHALVYIQRGAVAIGLVLAVLALVLAARGPG